MALKCIRRIHSNYNTKGGKCFSCQFCTYTTKTENEFKEHTRKWNITHSNINLNESIEEVNCEIVALKQIGIVLLGFQHHDEDWWSKWMEKNFKTPGKNPR